MEGVGKAPHSCVRSAIKKQDFFIYAENLAQYQPLTAFFVVLTSLRSNFILLSVRPIPSPRLVAAGQQTGTAAGDSSKPFFPHTKAERTLNRQSERRPEG